MIYFKIFETFKSQKELEKLTFEIINLVSKNTIYMFKKHPDKIYNLIGVMNVFALIDKNEYTEIYDFLNNFNIDINFSTTIINNIKDIKATYRKLNNYKGEIEVLIDEDLIEKIKDENIIVNKEFNILSNMLYYRIYKRILHELTHAYDDFRSNGSYINNKESENFYKNRKNIEKEDIEKINKNFIEYLNLRHEIDARFAETIHNIRFYNIIYDIDNINKTYKIKPFNDILSDFKSEFVGYNKLTEKNKKRILHLLGKFYIHTLDYIKKLNENEN